jgi:hypothetical protein
MHINWWANTSKLQNAFCPGLVRLCGAQETKMADGYGNDELTAKTTSAFSDGQANYFQFSCWWECHLPEAQSSTEICHSWLGLPYGCRSTGKDYILHSDNKYGILIYGCVECD